MERQGGTEGRKYSFAGLLTFADVPGGALWLFGAEDQGFLAFVVGLVIAPIAAAVAVFLTALVTHLLVVGSGISGFGATFRGVSYSSVTGLAPRDAAPRSGRRRLWGPRKAAVPVAPCRAERVFGRTPADHLG